MLGVDNCLRCLLAITNMAILWTILRLFYFVIFSYSNVSCQTNDPLQYQVPPCSNAEILQQCGFIMQRDLKSVLPNDTQQVCRVRADFINCTELALCYCKYPSETLYLSQAFKEVMKISYLMSQDNCQQFSSNYTVKRGVSCSGQNLQEGVSVNTSAAPIIQNLMSACPNFSTIFAARDRESSQALNALNYSQLCGTFSTFVTNFEKTTCECNLQDDININQVNQFEKSDLSFLCDLVPGFQPPMLEISCGGFCSLRQPGNKCEAELQQNLASAARDEEKICRHLSTYGQCFENIVCQCGFYQNLDYYSAVAMARFAFEVKQNCSRFKGMTFQSSQQGFPCPDDKQVTAEHKLLVLNTSQGQFPNAEDSKCPEIKLCLSQMDRNGAMAYNNKDLPAICNAMSTEIQCLENVTCNCGLLVFKLSEPMVQRRQTFYKLCNNVIPPVPDSNCNNGNICNTSTPLDQCDATLNKQASTGEDSFLRTCLNMLDKDACIKQVSCNCALNSNGSSPQAYNVYKALTDNMLHYMVIGCSAVSGIPAAQPGFICPGMQIDLSQQKLVLNWTQSAKNQQVVKECPSLNVCYNQNDVVESEALFSLDARRMCRNQLNTIKCKEKSLCECGLNNARNAIIEEEIILHNQNCSKYAPYGMSFPCKETDVCLKSQTTDVCLEKLSNPDNILDKCYEWVNYIKCSHDVTCRCNVLESANETRKDSVFINLAKFNYLLFVANNCSKAISEVFFSIPEIIVNQNYQCFNFITAEPTFLPVTIMATEKASEIEENSKVCPNILNCAQKYDQGKLTSFYFVDYNAYCVLTSYLIQCIQVELCKCNTVNTTEAKKLESFLISIFGDCSSVVNLGSQECGQVGEGAGIITPSSSPVTSSENIAQPISSTTAATKGPMKSDTAGNSKNVSGQNHLFIPLMYILALLLILKC